MNYWIIFLTGLTTGGLSCLAVQGGLLAATLATTAEKKDKLHDAIPTVVFLASKLVAYTLLGALLGYFGSLFPAHHCHAYLVSDYRRRFYVGTGWQHARPASYFPLLRHPTAQMGR